MSNRLDLKLSHILHLIFVKFGYKVKKKNFLKLSRLLYDLKISESRCKFLIKCRFYDLIPKHNSNCLINLSNLPFHSKKECRHLNKLIVSTQKRILNMEISDINVHKIFLKKSILSKQNVLYNLCGVNITNGFLNYYNTKLKLAYKIDENLNKKLESLFLNKYNTVLSKNDYKGNLSKMNTQAPKTQYTASKQ